MNQWIVWPLELGRPVIKIEIMSPDGGSRSRTLLADTGAGTVRSDFDVVLRESDCEPLNTYTGKKVGLRGSLQGQFRVYLVRVRIPGTAIERVVRAVGVRETPTGLDGIAAFRFLNDFVFGNFGWSDRFGVEPRNADRNGQH